MKAGRLALALAVLLFTAAFDACSARAAGCLKDERNVTLADGSARLRSYVCRSNGGDRSQVRVEYHRLSEAAAGSLLQKLPYPDLERVIGKPHVATNSVQARGKVLFDGFGTKQQTSTCYRLTIETPKGGNNYTNRVGDVTQNCGEKRTLSYFSFPDQEGMNTFEIPVPKDQLVIQKKKTWPEAYNFFYKDCERNAGTVECTVLWRGATRSDLQNYRANLKLQNQMAGIKEEPNAPEDDQLTRAERYFRLVSHLMGNGWQSDFLTVVGTYNECGGLSFVIHIRELILDVAVIENMTQETVVLEGLLGSEGSVSGLRKALLPTAGDGPVGILPGSRLEIRAREKVVVPLRMSWAVTDELREMFAKLDGARAKYERILAAPRETLFRVKGSDEQKRISKVRESFGPPSRPSFDAFVYGPEISLRGFVLNGERILFDEVSRNFIQITAGDGYGSCPFLYAWDNPTKSWIWYGKVIHQANAKTKETTHEIALTKFATRFRLSEEELELSYIDYAGLRVELEDGSQHLLKAKHDELANADARYVRIKPGQVVEFEFSLPQELEPHAIARSTLIVKGYYEPYSSMELSER